MPIGIFSIVQITFLSLSGETFLSAKNTETGLCNPWRLRPTSALTFRFSTTIWSCNGYFLHFVHYLASATIQEFPKAAGVGGSCAYGGSHTHANL